MKPAKPSSPSVPDVELRADAKRNRDRLLIAADAAFSERGADVSLDEIAKRAQVGIGTLYRHFPTREALLAATCDARLLLLVEKSRARAATSAGRDAVRRFLEELVLCSCMYRGLAASLKMVLQSGTPGCHATSAEGKRLLASAKQAGEIRRDVSFDDIVCMVAGISLASSQDAKGTRQISRLVDVFVDGLSVVGETAPAAKAGAARASKRHRSASA